MDDERIEALVKALREHTDLTNYDAVVTSIIEIDPNLTRQLVEFAIRQLLD